MGGGERPRHVVEGMLQRHLLSTGMAALPANADGVPFDCSHVYASGNLAADMFANVTAEATGGVLAVRLYNAAHDAGMKDMLSFLIARDTMHQQQWLAVIEELGGTGGPADPEQLRPEPGEAGVQLRFLGSRTDGCRPRPAVHRGALAGRQGAVYGAAERRRWGRSLCSGPRVPQGAEDLSDRALTAQACSRASGGFAPGLDRGRDPRQFDQHGLERGEPIGGKFAERLGDQFPLDPRRSPGSAGLPGRRASDKSRHLAAGRRRSSGARPGRRRRAGRSGRKYCPW